MNKVEVNRMPQWCTTSENHLEHKVKRIVRQAARDSVIRTATWLPYQPSWETARRYLDKRSGATIDLAEALLGGDFLAAIFQEELDRTGEIPSSLS
jgi:hypothetical protein